MTYLPLYKAISDYSARSSARFHMPGHKGVSDPFDVTEVRGTDNLHDPREAILESEKLCAKALGAADAFFSVNGSTACMMAMLRLTGNGAKVLLGRNCHKSAVNGVALAGLEAVSLFPDKDGAVSAEAVDAALEKEPCSAVFITSPTYRGVVSPIADIAAAAHKHGALLFVDAAHGAHFAFSGSLPPVPSEADMWCVSTHKTLNAMTQTAVLLAGESCPFSRSDIQNAMSLYQSTSPSYPLMLSIERAVLDHEDWDAHTARVIAFRRILSSTEGISLLPVWSGLESDLTRINAACSGLSGYAFQAELEKYGVIPEMSDRECVTLITTPADPDEWYERTCDAAFRIAQSHKGTAFSAKETLIPFKCGEKAVSVREAVLGKSELVPLAESVGRVPSHSVGCYPPGTAILFPGERITYESVAYLLSEREAGAELFGVSCGSIAVLKEERA